MYEHKTAEHGQTDEKVHVVRQTDRQTVRQKKPLI